MDINKEYEKYKSLPSVYKHQLLDTLFDVCFEQRDKLEVIQNIIKEFDNYEFQGEMWDADEFLSWLRKIKEVMIVE